MTKMFNQKVFWSGNCFDKGFINEEQGKLLLILIAAIAVLISMPIVLIGGVLAVLLGLIAFALAFFYTAPPLNLGARGLGEIDVGISFAMISFFSFFIISRTIEPTILILSIGIGITMLMVRLCDEAPGYPAHVRLGEKNLVVRMGRENMPRMIAVLGILFYVTVLAAALNDIDFALLFLTLPLFLKVIRLMARKEDDLRFWRAIPQMFKTAVANQMLIIAILILRTFLTSA